MHIFFIVFSKNNIMNKLDSIEKKISSLENLLQGKGTSPVPDSPTAKEKKEMNDFPATIKIEHFQVDQVIVKQLDLANNFGQLGIKELSGKLNIGTSFEGDISKAINKKLEKNLEKQAKVHIRAKKDERQP